MNLLTLRLGSRDRIHPKSPLLQRIACYIRRFRRYSLMFSRDLCPSLWLFLTTDKSVWITTYTCHSYDHPPLILLLQDTPKFSLMFRESFCAYCLAVPCRLNTPTDNFSHLPSIHSSPVDACMSRILEIPFDLPKILSILLLLKFLITCIMVNPISLVILLTSIVIIIWVRWFDLLRMLAILKQILEFLLPAQTSFLNMSWFSTNQLPSVVPLSLLNLSILGQSVCFWSFVLEIIIPLLSKHQIIQLSYNMMPVHSFFLWLSTDTHISSVVDRPIHCWILPDNALHIQ